MTGPKRESVEEKAPWNRLRTWLSTFQGRIFLFTTGLVATTCLLTGAFLIQRLHSSLSREYRRHAASVARLIADNAFYGVYVEDQATLREVVRGTASNPQLVYLAIVNNDGRTLVSMKDPRIRDSRLQEALESDRLRIVEDRLDGRPILHISMPIEREGPVRGGGTAVEGAALGRRGTLLLGFDLEELQARIASTTQWMILISIGIFVIAIGALVLITRTVTRPIRRIIQTIETIARGEWDLTRRLDAKGHDEINNLARSFNIFNSRLADLIKSILENSRDLSSVSEKFAKNAEGLSSGAQEQAASLQETTATMGEMASSVSKTADNSKKAETLAGNTVTSVHEGAVAVQEMIRSTKEIEKSSKTVMDFIAMIDGIADQTNLLALNAAIEAARAGEHGKGFAVVADEVKKLSERSSDAANEISRIIKESVQKSEAGNQLAENVGTHLSSILQKVNETANLIKEISEISEAQAVGSKQISQALNSLNKITQDNALTAGDMAGLSEEISRQAVVLGDIAGRFKI
jgi:methyl-accepting chemotaxis protein